MDVFIHITKAAARKLWAAGKPITLCPSKLRPGGPFASDMTVFPDDRTFDQVDNEFTYYNCSWEAGYYPRFYIRRSSVAALIVAVHLDQHTPIESFIDSRPDDLTDLCADLGITLAQAIAAQDELR